MILLVSFLTNSVDNFLTLLNVNGVNNLLASCIGDLARVVMGMLVALLLLLVFTLLDVNGVNNLLASCIGDLARVLMGMLVALPLLLVFTLRTTVVSIFSSIS